MREAGSKPTRRHRRTQTDRMPGTPAVADLLCTDPLVDRPARGSPEAERHTTCKGGRPTGSRALTWREARGSSPPTA
jgi:hypothetical protein